MLCLCVECFGLNCVRYALYEIREDWVKRRYGVRIICSVLYKWFISGYSDCLSFTSIPKYSITKREVLRWNELSQITRFLCTGAA